MSTDRQMADYNCTTATMFSDDDYDDADGDDYNDDQDNVQTMPATRMHTHNTTK